MLTGKVVEEFEKEDKKVVIRYPRMDDAEDLMNLMNSLIEEGAKISRQDKLEFEEEIDWMAEDLKEIEKKKSVHLILLVNGEAVGSASVGKKQHGARSHTGSFGIVLKKGFREQGLGSKLMEGLLLEVKEQLKLELLTLDVFESNKRAINFYKKFGFEKAGEVKDALKINEGYENKITMVKDLRD